LNENNFSTTKTIEEDQIRHEAEFSLPRILDSIYDMFLPDAQMKGLDFQYTPTHQITSTDPLVLMRIISNLVSNAIKYTPSGKVMLGVNQHNERLQIEVQDTGLGMDHKEFALAMNRSVRLEKGKIYASGEGYGLAIAQGLAKENGLKLYLKPEQNRGTTIILDIPKAS